MAHAEIVRDVNGKFRWIAIWNDEPAETSPGAFNSAEDAYEDASRRLPLTVVPYEFRRPREGREEGVRGP